MARDDLWTVLDVLKWTAAYFETLSFDSSRLDAELLLAHVLGTSRLDLYLRFDQPLTKAERADFKTLIKRRAGGEPVAYIVGCKAFWDLTLAVSPEVLIPRPDTECLVETALSILSRHPGGGRVWEPATGSGAVILSLARQVPDFVYVASDNSPGALHVARQNAAAHHLQGKVAFFGSDWFAAVKPGRGFDLIVANPPYVAAADLARLSPEILNFEPRSALDGGTDGLVHLRAIVAQAVEYLRPQGVLLLEIGWNQRAAVAQLAEQAGIYETPVFVQDLAGHDRVVKLRKKYLPEMMFFDT